MFLASLLWTAALAGSPRAGDVSVFGRGPVRLKLCAGMAALLSLLALAASASASHDVTERLSFGPTGGNGAFAATYQGISSDGTHVILRTTEKLVSGDTDSAFD